VQRRTGFVLSFVPPGTLRAMNLELRKPEQALDELRAKGLEA
jgi:hypothetical protein